jgi:hypothetical protein
MSEELLRRAATKLREQARDTQQDHPWCPVSLRASIRHMNRNVDLDIDCPVHGDEWCGEPGRYDGEYIALMHPPVALALADLLDAHADAAEQWPTHNDTPDKALSALILAREILREDS